MPKVSSWQPRALLASLAVVSVLLDAGANVHVICDADSVVLATPSIESLYATIPAKDRLCARRS